MYAIEFEAKMVDGMISIPKKYKEFSDNESVRVIILKEDSNDSELEAYKNSRQFQQDKKELQDTLDDYKKNGLKNFMSQSEYETQMDNYKKTLVSKYANN